MTTRPNARALALLSGTALLALAAACAKKDAATDSTAAAATTSSTAAGSGTAASSSTPMTQAQKQDLHDAIRGYRLNEGTVDKVIQVTQKMRALQRSNPQLAAAMEQEHGSGGDAKSIDEVADRLDAIPPVKATLSSVGLSARDYVLTMFTLMEAGAAYQFQKAGKLPPNSELAKDVSPENLAYVGAHQAQLQALEKANADANGGESE
jgi:hypothetical protein